MYLYLYIYIYGMCVWHQTIYQIYTHTHAHTHHSGWSCMLHVHLTLRNPIAWLQRPLRPLSTLRQLRVFARFCEFLLLLLAELPLNYGNLFCPKERSSKTTSNVRCPMTGHPPFRCCYRNTSHSRCPLTSVRCPLSAIHCPLKPLRFRVLPSHVAQLYLGI